MIFLKEIDFKCTEGGDPQQLVGQIRLKLNNVMNGSVQMRTTDKRRRPSQTSSVSTFTGTDSVRSATIRRRPKSAMIFYDSEDSRQSSAKHVTLPTPPSTPKRTTTYEFPLVAKLKANNLGLDKKPTFRYKASDNPIEKAVILLNYCIDDIERFMIEVKATNDDLNAKYASHPQRKFKAKKEHYQATDFVSIFQKFKLAFNILVKKTGFLCEFLNLNFFLRRNWMAIFKTRRPLNC